MIEQSRILLTGSSGFVGRNLLRVLPDCRRLDRKRHDLSQPETLREALAGVQAVVHLAGIPVGTGFQPAIRDLYRANVDATLGLLKAIQLHCATPPKLIFLSSIHVYGQNEGLLSEELIAAPTSPYGAIKHEQESCIRVAAAAGWINAWIFRGTHLYGPGSRPNYNSAIATFCARALAREPIDLYANGSSELDLLFISDAVSYLVRALGAADTVPCTTLNLATGRNITVATLIQTLEHLLGHPIERRLRQGNPSRPRISVEALIQILGPLKPTPLETGLSAQLESLSANRPLRQSS